MTHNRGRVGFSGIGLLLLSLTAPRPAGAAGYTITDLGVLSGGSQSYAQAINPAGQVAGYGNTGFGITHAFLYSGGHLTDLRTLGGSNSSGSGINTAGQVAGSSQNRTGAYHAFLYSGGKMKDLGTLGGGQSYAYSINDSGQVAGSSYPAGGSTQHAFLYSNGQMADLGTLGGTDSYAYGVNGVGQVVGWSYTAFVDGSTVYNAQQHAFLWANGAMTDLGTLADGSTSAAYAINSSGQVVGYSYTAGDSAYTPVLWQNGSVANLGSLGGTEGSALGINSAGQVVGWSQNPYSIRHAFLWQGGTMTDLNNLIPASSGWQLFQATAINDAGQIVGSGVRGGQFYQHAFLLTPQ